MYTQDWLFARTVAKSGKNLAKMKKSCKNGKNEEWNNKITMTLYISIFTRYILHLNEKKKM